MVVNSMEENSLGTAELGPKLTGDTGDTNDMVQQKMKATGKKLQKETDAGVAPPKQCIPDLDAMKQHAAIVSENHKHLHEEAPRQCDKSALEHLSQQQCKKSHLENSITLNLETATDQNVTGDESVRLLTKVARENRQTRMKIRKRILKYKQRTEILQRILKRIDLLIECEKFLMLNFRIQKEQQNVAEAMSSVQMAQVAAKLPVTHTLDRKPMTSASKQNFAIPENVHRAKPSQRRVIATCKEVHRIKLPLLNFTELKKRLQKDDMSNLLESILKTIKEDKVLEDEESLHLNVDKVRKKEVKLISKNVKDDEAFLPICHRAAFHGEYTVGAHSPQMQSLLTKKCAKFKNIKQSLEAKQDKKLWFSYEPVKCPAMDCKRSVFITQLSEHFVNNHGWVTMERIQSHQMKTFLFDTNLGVYNTQICQIAYFVKDKNVIFGRNQLANLLPVVLMACKTYCCYSTQESPDTLFMIWLTGLVPDNDNLTATITFFPTYCNVPEWQTTCTCTIYSMRAPQDFESIRLSGKCIIFHSTLLEKLTNNDKEPLGLQVVIN